MSRRKTIRNTASFLKQWRSKKWYKKFQVVEEKQQQKTLSTQILFFPPNSIFSINSLQISPGTYLLQYTFNITSEYIYKSFI